MESENIDISIVVPLYNEVESLPELISWIDRVCTGASFSYEAILIDDGSKESETPHQAIITTHLNKNVDLKLYSKLNKYPKEFAVNMKFIPEQNDFKSSDNFRFTDVGIPSVTFSQNWEDDLNPNYQTSNDFPETLNQRILYKAFQYLGVATLGIGLGIKP